MVKSKGLFEVLGITKQLEQQQQQQQHKLTEKYDKEIHLSHIELIYRAEGNANLVLALPQYKKVLRLPKVNVQQHELIKEVEEEKHVFIEYKHQQQQQQQQHSVLTVSPSHQQHEKDSRLMILEHFAAYIDIIRCLLGSEFVFEVDVVYLPHRNDSYWLNKYVRSQRPVYRLDKEYSGQHGLLLPDATQLPSKLDLLYLNLQSSSTILADTYAIEIKPKQGWLLPGEFYDLLNKKSKISTDLSLASKDCHNYSNMQNDGKSQPLQQQQHHHHHQIIQSSTSASLQLTMAMNVTKPVDIMCRYCSMQFLKLKQQKIHQISNYCPLKLFSGYPEKMLEALNALFKCPQNNLRIYRNGQLIYDDQLSKRNNIESILTIEKLQLIKDLLVICLLRDYTEQNVTCPKINDENFLATTTTTTPIITASTAATINKFDDTDLNETTEMLHLPMNCVLQKLLHLQLLAKKNFLHMFERQYHQKCDKSYNHLVNLLEKFHTNHNNLNFSQLNNEDEYLLGATALDCSIMITFREVMTSIENSSVPPSLRPYLIEMPELNRRFISKVTLLDLDAKPDNHFAKYCQQTENLLRLFQ